LVNLTEDEVLHLQLFVRDLILATDLSLHGIILRDMEERKKRIAREFQKNKPSLESEDKIAAMCCMMKCADLSNEIRPKEIAQKWAVRINKEFFNQTNREKELNLQVTAFMDPTKIIVAKEQMNFINGLCMPLYVSLASVFPTVKICVKQMESNSRDWETRFQTFFSPEQQETASNTSIWGVSEAKGTDLIAALSQRVSGVIALKKSSINSTINNNKVKK